MIDFKLYLISDRTQCVGVHLVQAVAQAVDAGVRCVQVREKDLAPDKVLNLVTEIRNATRQHGARIIVNSRTDVALASGADGVHLPETGTAIATARKCLGPAPASLIGSSTHSIARALHVEASGADFITFGPVFETPSKARYGQPLGLAALKEVCSSVDIPVFALGGIDADRAKSCLDAGAFGVAAISAILASHDIAETVASFRQALCGL